ncbi:MAG: rRNA pseudouridine synthase [Actinomycetota bacterium]|nr:rRNA pseudouridine synthase [Actinomycetota bacterium]
MRLQAFLSRAGAAPSRRKAESLISGGRVVVNGSVAELGSKVEDGDDVRLDGERVSLPLSRSYFALNKPSGFLTSMGDDRGRPTVSDIMPGGVPGLVPAGRLDFETTGLLILTNDGDLANRITHPSSEVEKEYELVVKTPPTDEPMKNLAAGPTLDDWPMLPPKVVEVSRRGSQTTLRLTIHEGRNRIIRRACESVGLDIVSLKRVRVGPVELGALPPGKYRPLSKKEMEAFS